MNINENTTVNKEEIFSPGLISSSLNPGPGVGGAPDLSPKQQGEEGSRRSRTWVPGRLGSDEWLPTSY